MSINSSEFEPALPVVTLSIQRHHIRRCFVQHLDAPYRTSLALSHSESILSIAVVYFLITKRDILLD